MAAEATGVERLDRIAGWPAPEERADWLGAGHVETALLEAYRTGRMHHAWLIGGPKGIGKATLAYRLARFVLAHPDPGSPEVQTAQTLALAETHPAFRRVAGRSHAGLLALERPYRPDLRRYMTALTVDEIRRTVSFFGSTSGEGGWRIAIVDPADDMNPNAANALLKVLEEPPPRSLFLIVCHAPGRLMPTIRSRCRRIDLAPLPTSAIVAALAANGQGQAADAGDAELVAALADGSLRSAILLLGEDGAESYRAFLRLVERFPEFDVAALHGFADRIAARGADDAYAGFLDTVRGWLDRRVRRLPEPGADRAGPGRLAAVPLARWAEVWEKAEQSAALADELNLDRKQVVLSILMALARATRM